VSGLRAQIGWAAETTWATAVTPTIFLPLISESMTRTKDPIITPGLIGGRRLPTEGQWEPGPETVSGSVTFDLHTHGIEQLLNCAIGTPAKTGSVPNVTRTYAPAALEFMTVEVARPTSMSAADSHRYSGCMVSSWNLTVSSGQIAQLSLDLVGSTETQITGSPATIALPTTMSRFRWDQAAVTYAGVTSYCFGEFSISGNNGLTTDENCLGTATIAQPREDNHREYTFEGRLRYPGSGANTPFATRGSVIAVSMAMTSGTHTLTATLPKVLITQATAPIGGPGRVEQTVSGRILGATASDAGGFSLVLVNGTA